MLNPLTIKGIDLMNSFNIDSECPFTYNLSTSSTVMQDKLPSSQQDGGSILTYNSTTHDITFEGAKVSVGHPDNFTLYFWSRQPTEQDGEGAYLKIFVDVSTITAQFPKLGNFIKNFNPEFDMTENVTSAFEFKEDAKETFTP